MSIRSSSSALRSNPRDRNIGADLTSECTDCLSDRDIPISVGFQHHRRHHCRERLR